MFPINHILQIYTCRALLSLHSTMFPINPFFGMIAAFPFNTLHSTMFPINHGQVANLNRLCILYIPLCFLLIPALK